MQFFNCRQDFEGYLRRCDIAGMGLSWQTIHFPPNKPATIAAVQSVEITPRNVYPLWLSQTWFFFLQFSFTCTPATMRLIAHIESESEYIISCSYSSGDEARFRLREEKEKQVFSLITALESFEFKTFPCLCPRALSGLTSLTLWEGRFGVAARIELMRRTVYIWTENEGRVPQSRHVERRRYDELLVLNKMFKNYTEYFPVKFADFVK